MLLECLSVCVQSMSTLPLKHMSITIKPYFRTYLCQIRRKKKSQVKNHMMTIMPAHTFLLRLSLGEATTKKVVKMINTTEILNL